jgi:molybdopterin molybdotransferase
MDKFTTMIPFEDAIRIVDESMAAFKISSLTVPVVDAVGCVLSSNVVSRLDLPPFDKSSVDGFAVPDEDGVGVYRLLEIVPAGSIPRQSLQPGTTIKVMTGAPIPHTTVRVVKVEHATVNGDEITIVPREKALNISRQAEDIRAGDRVIEAGKRVDEVAVATIISCGITEIEVVKRVRIAILVTGDELVNRFDELLPGKIMNSNGPLMSALARRFHLEVTAEKRVPDERAAVCETLRAVLPDADIVVFSGGVSVGDFDFVADAMEDVGLKILFNRVAIKPGKPLTFAIGKGKCVIGLPGNPVSVYVNFHLFVLRAASLLSGSKPWARVIRLPLAADVSRRVAERQEFFPASITPDGFCGKLDYHGSGHFSSLVSADGFGVLPAGVSTLKAGERIDFMPFAVKGL